MLTAKKKNYQKTHHSAAEVGDTTMQVGRSPARGGDQRQGGVVEGGREEGRELRPLLVGARGKLLVQGGRCDQKYQKIKSKFIGTTIHITENTNNTYL